MGVALSKLDGIADERLEDLQLDVDGRKADVRTLTLMLDCMLPHGNGACKTLSTFGNLRVDLSGDAMPLLLAYKAITILSLRSFACSSPDLVDALASMPELRALQIARARHKSFCTELVQCDVPFDRFYMRHLSSTALKECLQLEYASKPS